jgi:8-oxo-dGTP pyrophosphatase MutT (NUDIX family)
MTEPILAAGFVVFFIGEEYLEILMLEYDDYWGFPKGHLETDETELDAAMRELKEETGVQLLLSSTDPIGESVYEVKKSGQIRQKKVYYYAGVAKNREVVLSNEHHSYAWVHYRAAYRKLIFPDLRAVLQNAREWLKTDNHAAEFLARNLMKLN